MRKTRSVNRIRLSGRLIRSVSLSFLGLPVCSLYSFGVDHLLSFIPGVLWVVETFLCLFFFLNLWGTGGEIIQTANRMEKTRRQWEELAEELAKRREDA